MRAKNLLFAVVAGIAIAAGLFVAVSRDRSAEPASHGTTVNGQDSPALLSALRLPTPIQLPEVSLIDQSQAAVTRDTFRGQWDLMFFGFTHCPDICPMTLQLLAATRRALIDADTDILPRIVLVSVDPERDTAEILGRYVANFGDDNLAVTGELEEIRTLTKTLGIFFEKSGTDPNNYGVDHSAAVLLINPNAEFSALFSAPHVVAEYVHDLPILMSTD